MGFGWFKERGGEREARGTRVFAKLPESERDNNSKSAVINEPCIVQFRPFSHKWKGKIWVLNYYIHGRITFYVSEKKPI